MKRQRMANAKLASVSNCTQARWSYGEEGGFKVAVEFFPIEVLNTGWEHKIIQTRHADTLTHLQAV